MVFKRLMQVNSEGFSQNLSTSPLSYCLICKCPAWLTYPLLHRLEPATCHNNMLGLEGQRIGLGCNFCSVWLVWCCRSDTILQGRPACNIQPLSNLELSAIDGSVVLKTFVGKERWLQGLADAILDHCRNMGAPLPSSVHTPCGPHTARAGRRCCAPPWVHCLVLLQGRNSLIPFFSPFGLLFVVWWLIALCE